ncbi:MAG: hypothetical protein GQ564_09005 [Bacteroidales bacterium]|nr:hypothetical protein [Bacteroidales bacterium]
MYVIIKKVPLIILLISITLISYAQETLEVRLVSISNISNNHVGNEWSHDVTVNETKLTKYKSLSFKLSETKTLNITVNCTEFDEKYPDYGSNTKIIDLSKIDLSNEYLFAIEVTVTENGGRYKGNKAKWKYSFRIK